MNEIIDYPEFVALVIAALEASSVEYVIGGAMAVWAWGEPRSTMDLDLTVNIPVEAIPKLSEELAARQMPLTADIILEAVLEARLTHPLCANHWVGYKADFYILAEDDDLGQAAFSRRQAVDFGDLYGTLWVQSPEDLILYKMLFYRISRQTKHPRDVYSVLASQGKMINFGYIQSWAARKGLITLWDELLRHRPNSSL